jgi:hypothetical protein
MLEQFKKQLHEITKLVELCPDRYKEKCFEILLQHLLLLEEAKLAPVRIPKPSDTGLFEKLSPAFTRFIETHGLNEAISNVFQIDDGRCEIIVRGIETRKKATGQVRLGLLLGIKNLILNGSPNVTYEELRQLCIDHSVYDSANFAAIMKKNRDLFLTEANNWKLTKPGENKAAELIKELGQSR